MFFEPGFPNRSDLLRAMDMRLCVCVCIYVCVVVVDIVKTGTFMETLKRDAKSLSGI